MVQASWRKYPMAKAQDGPKRSSPQRDPAHAGAPSSGSAPLNFKVPLDFRLEFKTYAARHNKKLNQLLYEAFDALKAKNG
jgi:hypothetical protein